MIWQLPTKSKDVDNTHALHFHGAEAPGETWQWPYDSHLHVTCIETSMVRMKTCLHVCGMVSPRSCALPGAALRARIEAAAAAPGCAGLPRDQPAVRPGAQAAVQTADERTASITHPRAGRNASAQSAGPQCSPDQGHCCIASSQCRLDLGEVEL